MITINHKILLFVKVSEYQNMIYPQNQTSVNREQYDEVTTAKLDGKFSTKISLADLPNGIGQKLQHLDLSNDGFIDAADIIHIDQKEKEEVSQVI